MAEENVIQAVELDENIRSANTDIVDADQASRRDPQEPTSSEAEGANRAIDKNDPDFQQAKITEKKDRLGIVKDDPRVTTWVVENKVREKQQSKKAN